MIKKLKVGDKIQEIGKTYVNGTIIGYDGEVYKILWDHGGYGHSGLAFISKHFKVILPAARVIRII